MVFAEVIFSILHLAKSIRSLGVRWFQALCFLLNTVQFCIILISWLAQLLLIEGVLMFHSEFCSVQLLIGSLLNNNCCEMLGFSCIVLSFGECAVL